MRGSAAGVRVGARVGGRARVGAQHLRLAVRADMGGRLSFRVLGETGTLALEELTPNSAVRGEHFFFSAAPSALSVEITGN